MAMGATDTAFLGALGPDALAAGSLGTSVEITTLVILQGVLAALSALVAQARGAGNGAAIPGLYWSGALLAGLLVLPAMLLFQHAETLLLAVGEPPALAQATGRFLSVLQWSVPGAMVGTGLQRAFLPAIDAGWVIFPITLIGALLNAVLCYALIGGHFGFPAWGFLGPAIATTVITTGIALALTVFTHTGSRAAFVARARPRAAELAALLRLGVPIGATFAVETTLFLAVALLIGTLGAEALAAQQTALVAISVAFMIPLGLSQAANVRVGHAIGACDPLAARRAGLAAIGLGAAAEAAFAALNAIAPGQVVRLFLDPATQAASIALTLLRIAAVFQLADGIQCVAAGALRGLGDTRTPFILAALGYWAVGFPACWFLTLHAGFGPAGAWCGLAAGLMTVAILLTRRFLRRTAHLIFCLMHPTPDPPGPSQESVWSYPRPAIAQPTAAHVQIIHRGITVAHSRRCVRTLETSHPPTYYIPPSDVATAYLRPSDRRSFCEWKGTASYFDAVFADQVFRDVAWSYPHPTTDFAIIKDHLAFYAAPFDTVLVDGEQVVPQPGGFYGGWITSHVAGPFKGGPGSMFW